MPTCALVPKAFSLCVVHATSTDLLELSDSTLCRNLHTARYLNYAAAHADVVSNSYGGSDARDARYGAYYNHPGVAITVSSGDSGYGVQYPASSHYVTAVGGTTLTKAPGTARGWTETAWDGAGSGCSARKHRVGQRPQLPDRLRHASRR